MSHKVQKECLPKAHAMHALNSCGRAEQWPLPSSYAHLSGGNTKANGREMFFSLALSVCVGSVKRHEWMHAHTRECISVLARNNNLDVRTQITNRTVSNRPKTLTQLHRLRSETSLSSLHHLFPLHHFFSFSSPVSAVFDLFTTCLLILLGKSDTVLYLSSSEAAG